MLTPPSAYRHAALLADPEREKQRSRVAVERRRADAFAAQLEREREENRNAKRQQLELARKEREAYLANVRAVFNMDADRVGQSEKQSGKAAPCGAKPVAHVAWSEEMSTAAPSAAGGDDDMSLAVGGDDEKSDRSMSPRHKVPTRGVSKSQSGAGSATGRAAAKRIAAKPSLRALSADEEALQKSLLRLDFEEMKRQFGGHESLWRGDAVGLEDSSSNFSVTAKEAKLQSSVERLNGLLAELRAREAARAASEAARAAPQQDIAACKEESASQAESVPRPSGLPPRRPASVGPTGRSGGARFRAPSRGIGSTDARARNCSGSARGGNVNVVPPTSEVSLSHKPAVSNDRCVAAAAEPAAPTQKERSSSTDGRCMSSSSAPPPFLGKPPAAVKAPAPPNPRSAGRGVARMCRRGRS